MNIALRLLGMVFAGSGDSVYAFGLPSGGKGLVRAQRDPEEINPRAMKYARSARTASLR
jgi:hypothetical protein